MSEALETSLRRLQIHVAIEEAFREGIAAVDAADRAKKRGAYGEVVDELTTAIEELTEVTELQRALIAEYEGRT